MKDFVMLLTVEYLSLSLLAGQQMKSTLLPLTAQEILEMCSVINRVWPLIFLFVFWDFPLSRDDRCTLEFLKVVTDGFICLD